VLLCISVRCSSGSYRTALPLTVAQDAVTEFNNFLTEADTLHVVDMDDHLDDVTKDWRNTHIDAALA
jgi:Uncharacterised protein family (UPF0172)